MYLYYKENGDVIDAKLDSDAALFDGQSLSEIETISTFEIDEIPENKELIKSILTVRYDSDLDTGLHQLYILDGQLYWRDGDVLITPAVDQDKAELRSEFQNAVDTLTNIIEEPTLNSAQVIAAVKFIAKVLLNLLRLIKKKWS